MKTRARVLLAVAGLAGAVAAAAAGFLAGDAVDPPAASVRVVVQHDRCSNGDGTWTAAGDAADWGGTVYVCAGHDEWVADDGTYGQ